MNKHKNDKRKPYSLLIITLIIAGLIVGACKQKIDLGTEDKKQMNKSEALLNEWELAIESLDYEKAFAFYSEDAIYEDPAQK